MEFAIQVSSGTYAEYLAAARWAEDQGLAAFAIPDHYLSGRDPEKGGNALDAFAVLAGLARETSTIELELLVSPITFRHPAVLAKAYATIDQMSGGRFVLGVGTGWLEEEHRLFGIPFYDRSERFDRMEEALAYLRAAFSEPPREFQGTHYSFEPFDMQPRPPLRLVVGGTGAKRTPHLAGTYADELNAYPAAPDVYRDKVDRARSAAVAAGRDPEALLISSSGMVLAGDTQAEYERLVEEVATTVLGSTKEELLEAFELRNTPRGTWGQVRDVLGSMQDSGMSRFYLQTITGFDPEAIEAKLTAMRG